MNNTDRQNDQFDTIIIGAGPAGSAAAIKLAQNGFKVALIDRGMPVGNKNLSGGVLWGNDLAEILPEWMDEAPVERRVLNKKVGFLSRDDATILDLHFGSWDEKPYPGFSVLRSIFDEWLATKAEEHGVAVLPGIHIDSLIFENGRVVGVRQEEEELRAGTVIIAEGSNARLLFKHGLMKDPKKKQFERKEMMIGIKEVYTLDQKVLQDRFLLDEHQGVAGEFIIGCHPGETLAGGFFYTNKKSISIGVAIHLDSLELPDRSYMVMEQFKQHPYIQRLIRDATLSEYGAKTIPEMGIKGFPPFYGDGYLLVGDAAGFVFSNGIVIQGMNYGIKSGILAAETLIEAKSNGGFSKKNLSKYEKKLNNSYILKDFKKFKNVKKLTKNARLFKRYPGAINGAFKDFLTEQGKPKRPFLRTILGEMRSRGVGLITLARDGLTARHI